MAYYRLLSIFSALCLLSACSPSPSTQEAKPAPAAQAAKTNIGKNDEKPMPEAPQVSHPPLQIIPEHGAPAPVPASSDAKQ